MGLLYTPELAARAEAWVAQPLNDKRSGEGLTELGAIWAAIHRLPPVECRQCQYSERQASVVAYLRDFSRLSTSPAMSETQTASQYQIAPAFAGQSFVHEDLSAPVTAENLTDELAEFFISKGRSDAFIKRGAQDEAKADAPTDVTSENPLVPQADLEAEKEAHEATRTQGIEDLEAEKAAHAATKTKGNDALKAEKKAHDTTKKDLAEVNKQLTEANVQLAAAQQKLAEQDQKPHGENAGVDEADATK